MPRRDDASLASIDREPVSVPAADQLELEI